MLVINDGIHRVTTQAVKSRRHWEMDQWQASCSCGWQGIVFDLVSDAWLEGHRHHMMAVVS